MTQTPKTRLRERLNAGNLSQPRKRNSIAEVNFEWVGEPLNKDTSVELDTSLQQLNDTPTPTYRRVTRRSGLTNLTYYPGFKKNGVEFHIGDCVLVESLLAKPFVAIILQLWQDEQMQMMVQYRWFHRPEDAFPKGKKRKNGISDYDEELFYGMMDDTNELRTVQQKCTVLSFTNFQSKYPNGIPPSSLAKETTFFCRKAYDDRQHFIDLDWKDFYGTKKYLDPKSDDMFEFGQKKRQRSTSKKANDEEGKMMDIDYKDGNAGHNRNSEHRKESEGEALVEIVIESKKQRTPSKKKLQNLPKTPQKTPSKSTLKSEKTRINAAQISTPTPLRQRANALSAPSTPYEHARERLHVSAVPDSLPCREKEFEEISRYLESAIEESTGTCIYISGVPGTGKTATVHEVIRCLQARVDRNELSPFQFVEINGMKLTEPSHAYRLLWEALSEKRVTPNHALELLEKMFSTPSPRRFPCVVLMDELDMLVTKKQGVMYSFFEWPNRLHSKLIVIAVANTMDLPERMLSNKVSSRLGLTRINFQPYTHQQLIKIVESRLQGVDAFEKDAVEFAARKVSAVSGDARRALDICRRAVEIVEQNVMAKQSALSLNGPNQTMPEKEQSQTKEYVTISTIDRAIKEMFASPNVAFIRRASLHQKLFLLNCIMRLRRVGVADVEFGQVAYQHIQSCRLHNIEPPSTSDLSAICSSLGQARCLLVEAGKLDLYQRIRLNVAEEDVTMALKNDNFFKKLID